MEQTIDLQYQAVFQPLGVDVMSIAIDSQNALAQGTKDYGILKVPLVSDPAHKISEIYGVLQWAVATEEPWHSFVLVDGKGRIARIRDYGSPENGGIMYVPVTDLAAQV